jgi:nucleoside-diphosphate-sugar epimerase
MTRVAVTGPRGFLGRAVVAEAHRRGFDVVPFSLPRTPQALTPAFQRDLLAKARPDAVIHCAAVLRPRSDEDFAVNSRLPPIMAEALSDARPAATFLHVSSLNVIQESRHDAYTRSKRQAEMALAGSPAAIVRPGLIWSWDNGGDSGRVSAYLQRALPFHPVPYPGPRFRPVLVADLAAALLDLVGGDVRGKRINVCGDIELTLWELVRALSESQGGRPVALPIGFIERIFPKAVLGRLPTPLRSFSAADDDTLCGRDGERLLILPFTRPTSGDALN